MKTRTIWALKPLLSTILVIPKRYLAKKVVLMWFIFRIPSASPYFLVRICVFCAVLKFSDAANLLI